MKTVLAFTLAVLATPAAAEVVSAGPNGFEVREKVQVPVSTAAAFASFADIGGWWDARHSYSGSAKNLSLSLKPGGCFCERLPKSGGGVEHLRVAFVDPGKQLVLTGSLGPLLYDATAGVMNIQVKKVAGGSEITLDYKVAGFVNGGADKLAPVVDGVLGGQMDRYRAYAASRRKR